MHFYFFTLTCHRDKEEDEVGLQAVAMQLLLGRMNVNRHCTVMILENRKRLNDSVNSKFDTKPIPR